MIKKKNLFIALVLILALTLSPAVSAVNWEDFTDISGHWAEDTMKKGVEDKLISGFEDNTVRPNAPITTAQMITILCRVLNAAETTDPSSLGITPNAWYFDAAGKALHMGLISSSTGDLDTPMSRQDALSMMAKAFCIIPADPDLSILNSYSDAASVKAENRGAMAALISKQYIQGFAGSLNANSSITRSEFLTVLYRVSANYTDSYGLSSALNGGTVVNGSISLYNCTLNGALWMDCSSDTATLSGVKTASDIVLLSHELASLTVDNGSQLQRLAVASESYNLSLAPSGETKIGVLQLHGSGSAVVSGGNVSSVEVTGRKIYLSLSGKHESLIIGGSNNCITLKEDCEIEKLIILGENNTVNAPNSLASIGEIKISGNGNSFVVEDASESTASPAIGSIQLIGSRNKLISYISIGAVGSTIVGGSSNQLSITGKGKIESLGDLEVSGSSQAVELIVSGSAGTVSVSGDSNRVSANGAVSSPVTISGSSNQLMVWSDKNLSSANVSGNGNWLTLDCLSIDNITIDGTYNTVHKCRSGSVDTLSFPGKHSALVLYVDNTLKSGTIKGTDNTFTVNGSASQLTVDGRNLTLDGSGSVDKLTLNATGSKITAAVASLTDNSHKLDEERVLKLVTPTYKGNYTLQWALDHDYEDYEKEIFVNSKGYSSKTSYLLWINLATQRVNIFEGTKGSWKLIRECLTGTGASGTGTPVGVYDITYKLAAGWTTSSYTCKPVVGFKKGTGYAFHSRLYYPNSNKIKDASIGFPVSHGCARMYDDDINYIYNSIPIGSTVVVY